MQGVQVRSLAGELRYHMPQGKKKKKIKNTEQKQYCNKFNKDFKNCLRRRQMGSRLGIYNWPIHTSWGEKKMSSRPDIHHQPPVYIS